MENNIKIEYLLVKKYKGTIILQNCYINIYLRTPQ